MMWDIMFEWPTPKIQFIQSKKKSNISNVIPKNGFGFGSISL
jgi:hypothetical protein